MSEADDFLADILPRLREAEIALHNGDAGPRSALWSHDDPVTLFGAEVMAVARRFLAVVATPEWFGGCDGWSRKAGPGAAG